MPSLARSFVCGVGEKEKKPGLSERQGRPAGRSDADARPRRQYRQTGERG